MSEYWSPFGEACKKRGKPLTMDEFWEEVDKCMVKKG